MKKGNKSSTIVQVHEKKQQCEQCVGIERNKVSYNEKDETQL